MTHLLGQFITFILRHRTLVICVVSVCIVGGSAAAATYVLQSRDRESVAGEEEASSVDDTRKTAKDIATTKSDTTKQPESKKESADTEKQRGATDKKDSTKPSDTKKVTNNKKSSVQEPATKQPVSDESKSAPSPEQSQCPSGYSGTYPSCVAPPPSPVGVAGSWTLKMRDEFDGVNLGAQWATQRGPSYSYGDPYNASIEDAFYLPTNPKVQDGKLVLTLNQGVTNGYPYSSGMVQNGRSWNYQYGYVEARVKVPGNTGVWPAFWTLPAPVDAMWPPEIDIFEFGLSGQTRPGFNYHYNNGGHQQSGLTVYGNSGTNYTQDYHVYGMLWTASKIQVYIDGEPGPSYTNAAHITSVPQYIIFNLALKKGYTPPSGTAMYVDYVRVWQ